jgi:hypothetical protein
MEKLFIILKKRTAYVLLLFFALSFVFRLPTLFNDYYDVDELSAIVQTWQYLAGEAPGVDFSESKLPVYHSIFKLSYSISYQYGWVIVHFITILIVFFTSWFIYLTGKKLKGDESGIYAGILYAVLISSFNRMFMATNAEIIYNLPIIAGIYCLILFFSYKEYRYKIILFLFFLVYAYVAANIKFHGIILFGSMLFFFIFYRPYLKGYITKKYVSAFFAITAIAVFALIIDYFTTDRYASKLFTGISKKIFYAVADKGLNPLKFIAVFFHRQGMLVIWHFILWIPAVIYIWKIFREKRFRVPVQEAILVTILIFTYMMTFGGGARMYFHYYMAVYPALCITTGVAFYSLNNSRIIKLRKKFILLLLIPGLFFFLWNTKDIILKHCYPEGFTNEGKLLYWTRAVLTGAPDHYLLPDNSYSPVADDIKNNTHPDDRIFVWGNGAYLYYFSERKPGIRHMWPKNSALRIQSGYRTGSIKSISEANKMENDFINQLIKSNSKFFIDTSKNGLAGFNIPVPPLLQDYINKNYKLDSEISKMLIYKKNN